MIWQEFVFLVGGFATAAALIPTVLGPFKPAPSTSALTGVVLTAFTVAFLTLEQFLSAAGIGLTASLWWLLLAQGLRGGGK